MRRLLSKRRREVKAFAFYDVSGCIKCWGRRGILIGGVFGFALGVGFVAIPFTSDVLTFGIIGTLIVAAVEGAVIAGAFAVCIAAFYGKGDIYSRDAYSDRLSPVYPAQKVIAKESSPAALRSDPGLTQV